MFELFARVFGIIEDVDMEPEYSEVLKCDYHRPARVLVVPPGLEERRIEFLSHPANAAMTLHFIGRTVEDSWSSKMHYEKLWNSWIGRLCSWLGAGIEPGDAPSSKIVMSDVLEWWNGAPAPVKELLEPLICQWKVFVFYCDDSWHMNYKADEAVAYDFTKGNGVTIKS